MNDGGGGGYTQTTMEDVKGAGGAGYWTWGIQAGVRYDDKYSLAGRSYGDHKLTALYLGSGGGSYKPLDGPAVVGGRGGGALWLRCDGIITMCQWSRISCDGQIAESDKSGSGSGGSIHLLINNYDSLKQEIYSMINASGGYRRNASTGGQGRIRVEIMDKEARKLRKSDIDCSKYNFVPPAWVKRNLKLGFDPN